MKTEDVLDQINYLGVVGDALLSKSGMITFSYFLEQPTTYSLSEEDFERRNKDFFRAFSHLGNDTYVHKQDIYQRDKYDSTRDFPNDTFISRAEQKFFHGNEFMNHISILSFSIDGLRSLESSYISNPISYKSGLSKIDKERLEVFIGAVETAVDILKNLPNTKLALINTKNSLKQLFIYCNGFYNDGVRRDFMFDDDLEIGEKKGAIFAICKAQDLPSFLETSVDDETIYSPNVKLKTSFLEYLGLHLRCTHTINQVWHFSTSYKGDLALQAKQHAQYKSFDKEIEFDAKNLEETQNELLNDGNIIVRTHFNIILLDDLKVVEKAKEEVKSYLNINDVSSFAPMRERAKQVFFGTTIGAVNTLPNDFMFKIDLKSSLCLMTHYSTFKSDSEGIFFHERIFNTPMRVNLWDAPLGYKLPARNAIIFASTGGGKSVTALNIVQQYKEQGVQLVIVEFGSSFKMFAQLYPNDSLHIDYDGTQPLGINPFTLHGEEGAKFDEKIKTLTNIVLKFWRDKECTSDSKQIVSVRLLLIEYYKEITFDHDFASFYKFVKDKFEEVAERLEIKREHFGYDSFVHNCREFLEGGIYENISKPSTLGDTIKEKSLVVFELTQIKKDPFLVSVIFSILIDTIETKLLDRSNRGMLVFDEYAEAQTIKDEFDGANIHSTVAFAYQKLRKEGSGVMTILQSPSQLSDDNYSKGIISNTQQLIVLPTTQVVYDAIVDIFAIKQQTHIDLMRSIQNNFQGNDRYSEVFMRFLDMGATALRIKLSPERFMAFQTDGELWKKIQDDYLETKCIETSITKLLNVKKDETTISI